VRLLSSCVAIVVVGLLASVAHAGSGALVPPMRIDLGPAMSKLAPMPGFQLVAGVHWASLTPSPRASIDVGIGMIGTLRRSSDQAEAGAPSNARAVEPAPLSLIGGYLEVATRTNGNGWWRTWVGSRLESGRASQDGLGHAFVGVATRISTEAYLTAAGGGGGGGLVVGALAIGLYAEVAARRFDSLGNDVGVSAGLSMRIPLIIE